MLLIGPPGLLQHHRGRAEAGAVQGAVQPDARGEERGQQEGVRQAPAGLHLHVQRLSEMYFRLQLLQRLKRDDICKPCILEPPINVFSFLN